MESKIKTFIGIMLFYIFISYIIFPTAFFYLVERTVSSAGNGFIIGSLLSIVLWLSVGKAMIR